MAYVFGRRQDKVFLKLKALLEPFGITRYYTDGWGAYERHIDAEQHKLARITRRKSRANISGYGPGSSG